MERSSQRHAPRRLNLALIGYGAMNRQIEKIALERGHEILERIDSKSQDKFHSPLLDNVDVCIEFTQPNAVVNTVRALAARKKNILVGTTGWDNDLSTVEQIVKEEGIGLLHAPNFALGVYLFMQLAEAATQLMNSFPQFDVLGVESHHAKKADAPSGTGTRLITTVLKNIERKKRAVTHLSERLHPEEFHLASLRGGFDSGTHSLIFDAPTERLEITHTSRSRDNFAGGAVEAAEWLHGKQGLFTLDDFFAHKLNTLRG